MVSLLTVFCNPFTWLLTVVYNPSVWTEFGYTVQRYIGSSATIGIKIFAIVFGIGLVAKVIRAITR